MSLARAFTKRIKRTDDVASAQVGRSTTVKYTPGTIKRNLISLPTELISTTNVHALNAPDIRSVSSTSSNSSIISGGDSDFSTIDKAFLTADSSSIESSPVTPMTPPTENDSNFFAAKPMPSEASAPMIPKRAPSHSKKAHVELSRKRSIQRLTPPPTAIGQQSTRTSADIFSPTNVDSSHPFQRELEQVSEVAVEFGAKDGLLEEEEQEMMAKGLCKFSVADYLHEIAPLYGGIYEDQLTFGVNPWI